jgi:hypothetical protein
MSNDLFSERFEDEDEDDSRTIAKGEGASAATLLGQPERLREFVENFIEAICI